MTDSKTDNKLVIAALLVAVFALALAGYAYTLGKEAQAYAPAISRLDAQLQADGQKIEQLQGRVDQLEKTVAETRMFLDKYKNEIRAVDVIKMDLTLAEHEQKLNELKRTLNRIYNVK